MKFKYFIKLGVVILMIGVVSAYIFGIKNPPKQLMANELSLIESVEIVGENIGKMHILNDEEIECWKTLKFNLSTENYPGETPDFVIKLNGKKVDFTAMYNKESKIIFFSFIPEISYGFLNSPPPGGWIKPIYETEATEGLLRLLQIKKD